MSLDLAQRLHAWVNGLGRSTETQTTQKLFSEVGVLFRQHNLLNDDGRDHLIGELTQDVLAGFDLPPDHPQQPFVWELIDGIFNNEDLFVLPNINGDQPTTTAQHWDIRKSLERQHKFIEHFDETYEHLRLFFCNILDPVYTACPSLLDETDSDGITIPTDLTHLIGNIGAVVEQMARMCSADDFKDTGILEKTSSKLEYNLIVASGGNPNDPKSFNRAAKYPKSSDISNPKDLIYTYLGGTPLVDFFAQSVNFTIPNKTRFEHHHIVAGSGHGKTQTLQYLITRDLEVVSEGKRSVVVIDSQGDLIENISNLAIFAEGGALADRIVIIDPTDVEWPVSLNLFDVGQDRLAGYAPLERERLTNSILELYDFVLGSLLDAGMTQKQNVIFRYVTRLLLHIPNATIHTLRELMEEGSSVKFAEHIAKLSGTSRHFFESEFDSKEFAATKRQVLRRLWGILENQTFERMFSHPKSKLDLFSEMNAGKVILINTAKDLLKESGTEIFGRFFIALIAQAAQERATLPQSKRMDTMVYIDEAADYFDQNIATILSQARKYNIGMILAHQYLGQLEPRLQEAFGANTSIKMAGGVSNKDARLLSGQLHADPLFIETQAKGSFASYIRGTTPKAIPLRFPFFVMEQLPKVSVLQRHALQERMRAAYSVHYSMLAQPEPLEDEKQPGATDHAIKPTKGW